MIKNLGEYLLPLYNKEAVDKIQKELVHYAQTVSRVHHPQFHPAWYKDANAYVMYPDGIKYTGSPLQDCTTHLYHIKKLGCNVVHILPFSGCMRNFPPLPCSCDSPDPGKVK